MKIALVVNDDFSAWHFRGGLIRALAVRGADVCVIVPPGAYRQRIESLGARCIHVPMSRFVSPVSAVVLTIRLFRLFWMIYSIRSPLFRSFLCALHGPARLRCAAGAKVDAPFLRQLL